MLSNKTKGCLIANFATVPYRFYLSFSDSINLITSEYKNLLFDLCGS